MRFRAAGWRERRIVGGSRASHGTGHGSLTGHLTGHVTGQMR
jgi:hypothetical protein